MVTEPPGNMRHILVSMWQRTRSNTPHTMEDQGGRVFQGFSRAGDNPDHQCPIMPLQVELGQVTL